MKYVRPPIGSQRCYLPDGSEISFGEQHVAWPGGQPPAEFYSVDPFPERFAALHEVAEALVAWLVSTFAVETQSVSAALSAQGRGPRVVRSLRLSPSDPSAASLSIHWTAYPGVILDAGAFFSGAYPMCGCRACDETCASAAGALESDVFDWVRGRFEERASNEAGDRWQVSTVRTDADGTPIESSTAYGIDGVSLRIRRPGLTLAGFVSSWMPWPEKSH